MLRRVLLAILLCCLALPAFAVDYRFAPAPAWVKDAALPDAGDALPTGDGTRYLLLDDQVDVRGPQHVAYRRIATRMDNARALSDGGQIEIWYQPEYQRVEIHAIEVRRGGQVTDRRDAARIEVLRREEDLDDAMYDGEHTLSITLPDLRVGDIVDYSYSVVGDNPVFGGDYHGSYTARFSSALAYRRVRALYPAARPLHVHAPGDFARQDGAIGDARFVEFSARRLPRTRTEPDTPSSFDPYGDIALSSASTWSDVVHWALPMYNPRLRDRALAADLVQRLQLNDTDKRAALLRAIAFVEGEIRYTALDMGKNSHEPNLPETVVARRFGDCKDKAVLLSALLHEAGIVAEPVLVDTEGRESLATRQPSAVAFDHVVVRAHLDNKPVWIDPTRDPETGALEDRSPLPFRLGLPICARCDRLVDIPQPAPRAPLVDVGQRVDLATTAAGYRADFTIVTDYRNEKADGIRDTFADGEDALGAQYVSYMRKYYDDLQSERAPTLHDRGAGAARAIERYVMRWPTKDGNNFDIVLFQLLDWMPDFDLDKRTTPMALEGPAYARQTIRTHLSGGWDIDADDDTVANAYFRFHRMVRVVGDKLEIVGEWRRLADQVPARDYAKVRADVRRVRELMEYSVAIGEDADEAAGQADTASVHRWRLIAAALAGLLLFFAGLAYRQESQLRRLRTAGAAPQNRPRDNAP